VLSINSVTNKSTIDSQFMGNNKDNNKDVKKDGNKLTFSRSLPKFKTCKLDTVEDIKFDFKRNDERKKTTGNDFSIMLLKCAEDKERSSLKIIKLIPFDE
jgi:hypothetical protein